MPPKSFKQNDFLVRDVRPLPPDEPEPVSTKRKVQRPFRQWQRWAGFGLVTIFAVFALYAIYHRGFRQAIDFGHQSPATASFSQGLTELFGGWGKMAAGIKGARADLKRLYSEGFGFFFSGRGEEFLAILKSLQKHLNDIFFGNRRLADFFLRSTSLLPQTDLVTLKEGLDSLIVFLDQPGERRLIVLFQNPSEIRPAGGFAGSYGEMVLEKGGLKAIKTNDIYYPDRFLRRKIVPPVQLQSLTPDWGARDAGWFFDFPLSAEKTLSLLESSEVYAKEGVKFDGLIAVNVRVIEDFLAITGPIKVPEYNLTLTKDNFLRQIQQEVEAGRDKKPGQNPKKILGVITPILTERLNQLSSEQKKQLMVLLAYRAFNKDLQFYFRDSSMENLVDRLGWSGQVFQPPADFGGDYLAVVNANIAGGKTDAFIKQTIRLRTELEADGQITNHLVIERQHRGEKEAEPWYRTPNQNFLKVFLLSQAQLISLEGAAAKEIKPRLNYGKSNYLADADLTALEATRQLWPSFNAESYLEAGKKVIAAWFNLNPGEKKQLTLDYRSGSFPVVSGVEYRFVLDKQSGVESNFLYEIQAPSGFHWAESNNRLFRQEIGQLPGRLEIKLRLLKDE